MIVSPAYQDYCSVEVRAQALEKSLEPVTVFDMQRAFYTKFKSRFEILVNNVVMSHHTSEMDLVGLREKNGGLDEIELKVSLADYLADFRKVVRVSQQLNNTSGPRVEMNKHVAIRSGLMAPNYFSFMITHDMYAEDPKFYNNEGCGLYVCRRDSLGIPRVLEVRPPTMMHQRKTNLLTRYKLAIKLQQRYWGMM